jgi:replicative DNA helicase
MAMEEALIKRILPHSDEAERAVIGSMLMDADAIVTASEIISTDDFYQRQYGILFEVMTELYGEDKPVDLVTLQERMKNKDVPPELTSVEFISGILNDVPTSANVKHYAQTVAEKALLRRMIKANEDIANTCYLGKEPVDQILEDTEKKIFDLLQKKSSEDFVPIRDVVLSVIDKIELAAKHKGTVTGLATGFYDLDYKTSGFQPSDLILVAARPSMGKTAFVLNLAQYISIKNQVPTAIFSLEMSKDQLVNRLLAMESKVDSQLIRTGNLSSNDWEKLIESAGDISKAPLIIDDTPGISISELRSKCRKFKLENNLGLVIIDYLQLMSGGNKRTDSRQQEISDISRSLKALAREINAPVIALSQLSRACETRPDHRPILSDLRESGAIEQDADVVMFIYRDDYYNKDTDKKNISEIIIAKQRNGPIGTVELVWLPNYTKFANKSKQSK